MDLETLHTASAKTISKTKTSDSDRCFESPQSSLLSAGFNLVNSIIGSGVIGVAYAIRQSGLAVGIGLILLVGWMTDASAMMLIRAGNLAGTTSYQGTVWMSLGKPGFYLLTFLQFTYPFLALLSYNIILGDNFTKVLVRLTGLTADSWLVRREVVISAGTLLVTLPLSLYRHIHRLAKISFVSFILIMTVCLAMVYRTFTMWHQVPVADGAWRVADTGVVQAAGVIAFMFMCHHNTFLIYWSLEEPSEERWARVSRASVGLATLVGLLFGITGYALFNSFTLGNVMENYCDSDDLMNVMRMLYLLSLLLTFPIDCFVTREVVENWLSNSSYTTNTERERPLWRHVTLTVLICCGVAVLSAVVRCLGPVLAISGTLFATPLAFILPPVCYLKLSPDPIGSRSNIVPLIILGLGTALGLCGLVEVVTGAAMSSSNCGDRGVMFYCSSNWTQAHSTHWNQ